MVRQNSRIASWYGCNLSSEIVQGVALVIPDREFGGHIFDWDGTLADTMPLHYRAWTRLVAELGGSFPEELFYESGGKPTVQILRMLRYEHGLKVADVERAAKRNEGCFLEMLPEVKPIAPG